ncbi:hypothetical protein [Desulfosarcina cetonica]|uniref:hypothetical protein n=1 Tax=Desulfosarcina cetonica TaxID=90730 RepID=UPI0006CFFC7E|nr:hypothetical protein [Desulfosarcina cetonica]
MDAYFDQAINAGSEAEAIGYWKLAQWDGKTGCGPRGDAPWAWLINLDHVYFVSEHLNIGASRIEPHGQYHHVDLEGVMVTDQHRYRRTRILRHCGVRKSTPPSLRIRKP